jgi:hypothetical protein
MAIARSGDNIICPLRSISIIRMWLTMQGIEARILPTLNGSSAIPQVAEAARLADERTGDHTGHAEQSDRRDLSFIDDIGVFELAQAKGIALVWTRPTRIFRSSFHRPTIFTRPDWRGTFCAALQFSKYTRSRAIA